MAAKRKGLGRGLDALFPDKPKTPSTTVEKASENEESKSGSAVNESETAASKAESSKSKISAEKTEKTLKAEKVNKTEKAEKASKAEKTRKIEREEKASKAEKASKTEKAEKIEKAEKTSRPEKPEKVEKAGKSKKIGETETEKEAITTEKSDKTASRKPSSAEAAAEESITKTEKSAATPEILVKISKVSPNREQPRKHFDEDALLELSESIKQYGIIQPILVSNKMDFKGEEYYEIIAGERRWRAARMAGLKEVPVIIKEFSDQQIVEISLIENIQREDLNPIEEAQAYKRLIEEYHLKQDEVAEKVSKSRTAVANSTRLLKLDERIQEMLINDMISAGHARALLAIVDNEKQYEIAMKVFDEKLSVRETEILVKRLTDPVKPKKKVEKNFAEDAIYEGLEEKLKGIVGTKVSIQRKRNHKGKIEIEYYSQDELERILDLFDSIRES